MAKVAVGPTLSNISGRYGGVVVANGKSGLVVRREARYRKVLSATQAEAAERLRLAAAVWTEFDFAQAGAWDDYAQTVWRHNPLTGEPYHPSGYNAFMALATKVLQVDPEADVPTIPPTGVFVGDSLLITVDAESPSTCRKDRVGREKGKGTRVPELGQNDTQPLTPSALAVRHLASRGGAGAMLSNARTSAAGNAIVFSADEPNSPGTTTELLLEELPNVRRKPTGRFRSAGFHRFEEDRLQAVVTVEPGAYVAGYRFVEVASGRQTLALDCGRINV